MTTASIDELSNILQVKFTANLIYVQNRLFFVFIILTHFFYFGLFKCFVDFLYFTQRRLTTSQEHN